MIHKIQGIHKKQGGTGRPGDNGDAVGTSRPGNTRYGGIQGIEGIDGIHEIQGIQGIQVFRGFTTIVCSWIDMVETFYGHGPVWILNCSTFPPPLFIFSPTDCKTCWCL